MFKRTFSVHVFREKDSGMGFDVFGIKDFEAGYGFSIILGKFA